MAEKPDEAVINMGSDDAQTSTMKNGRKEMKKVEKKPSIKMAKKTSFVVPGEREEDEGNPSQKNDHSVDDTDDEDDDEEEDDEDDDSEEAVENTYTPPMSRDIKVKERLLPRPKWKLPSLSNDCCSIFRFPHFLRRHNKNCYDPQVISIGPFHYNKRKTKLRQMEEHKRRYLKAILRRSRQDLLDICWDEMKTMEREARNYYSEAIELDSTSFVDMLILDGFFIIELFRKKFDGKKDPIFSLGWLSKATFSDLLLIENQIPFFVLLRLYDLANKYLVKKRCTCTHFFTTAQYYLFHKKELGIPPKQIQHLLHLVHCYCTSFIEYNPDPSDQSNPRTFPSAVKLHERGIEFEKKDTTDDYEFLPISFQRGVIEIPAIEIWDKCYVRLVNLIAFEQCYPHCMIYVTAYAHFMDYLIDSEKDVELLHRQGIFENNLGNEARIASLFNNMIREAVRFDDDDYLAGLYVGINEYYERVWPRLRASLMHGYFKNPWAIIVFLASLFLLLLAMTQTFFTSFPKFAYGK